MKAATSKKIVQTVSRITVLFVAALVVTAVFFVLKPVDPNGAECTFDNWDCESNGNFFVAMGCVYLAFLIGIAYAIFRVVLWLLAGRKR